MAKRAAAVKATATTKKAVGSKKAAKTDSLPTAIGEKTGVKPMSKPLAEEATESPRANGKGPSTRKASDRPLCWQCKVRQLSADDVRKKVGVCEECRDPSRRVSRWARDEALQKKYPEEYKKPRDVLKFGHGHMSLALPEWRAINALLKKLVKAGQIDKAEFEDMPVKAMVDWILEEKMPGSSVNEILQMPWQEAEELVRIEVEQIKVKAESDRTNDIYRDHAAASDSELASTVMPLGASLAAEPQPKIDVAGAKSHHSPDDTNPKHLGLWIDREGVVSRQGHTLTVNLRLKPERERLFRVLLESGTKTLDHKFLQGMLKKKPGALTNLIAKLNIDLRLLRVEVSERYHRLEPLDPLPAPAPYL